MKRLVLAIVCIIISNVVIGQRLISTTLDSLLSNQLNQLPDRYRQKFDSLLLNKENMVMMKRLDTIPFDYLILEESFRYYNPQFRIVELYYTQPDSLPTIIYENGFKYHNYINPSSLIIFYRTDLGQKLVFNKFWNSLLSNQQFQTYKYSEIQHYYGGCAFDSRNVNVKKASRQHKKEMTSTYKIQILINKVTNDIKVSFQVPPKDPKFTMKNGGFNWW